jgi:hypothetical protein
MDEVNKEEAPGTKTGHPAQTAAHKESEKPNTVPHRIHQSVRLNRPELLKKAAEQDRGHAAAVEADRKQQAKYWQEQGATMGLVTVMVNGTTHRIPAQPIIVDLFKAMIRVPGPLKLDGRLLSDPNEVLSFVGGEYFTTL